MPRPLMPKLVRARVVVAPEPPLGRYWCLCSRERARFERCLLRVVASGALFCSASADFFRKYAHELHTNPPS